MAPTLAELDARSRFWPWPCRAAYLTIKWSLVGLGVYLLVGLYITNWGLYAGLWFLIGPALWGLYLGFSSRQPPQAP